MNLLTRARRRLADAIAPAQPPAPVSPPAPPGPPPPLSRHQYKETWNAQAGTEDEAKMAVSFSTDEELYRSTALDTLGMLKDSVGVRPDDVILEIGAGVGRVGSVLAPICREWIGADVSPRMLGHIRRRLAAHANVRTVELSGYDLAPIETASVDVVYSTVVFMHLDEWDRYNYILEGMRVLRPGGRMYVDNANLLSDDGWAMFEAHRIIPPAGRPSHISKTSTPDELATYFRRAGFVDIGQRETNLWIITWGVKPRT